MNEWIKMFSESKDILRLHYRLDIIEYPSIQYYPSITVLHYKLDTIFHTDSKLIYKYYTCIKKKWI